MERPYHSIPVTRSSKKSLISGYIILSVLILLRSSFAQSVPVPGNLPVNILPAAGDTSKPLIIYITGDGGWNKFSKNLGRVFNENGYPVIALNANTYFWKKKTAAQTASDLTSVLRNWLKVWNRKKIVMVGYSFGADVMPFVFNNLPPDLATKVLTINLLSPSSYTDFEIHLSVMLGAGVKGGESVVAAINRINGTSLVLISGKEETDFPADQLRIRNYFNLKLEGGHHYDGDETKLCNTIIQHIPVR